MKRSALLILTIIAAGIAVGGCSRRPEPRLRVVATTTIMESAIKEIGGARVSVIALIPPGSCPGHYDVRPGDILSIKSSRALFTHGYEQFVPRLIESAGEPAPKVRRVAVEGNWLMPDAYAKACHEVSRLLCGIDPSHAEEYRSRYASLSAKTAEVGMKLRRKAQAAGLERIAVICSDQQASCLKWMGFDVIGTYGRAEEFTPAQLHDLAKIGRDKKVCLVVDNLQSGPAAGLQLAEEIGASHLTLSNFPGGFRDTSTWDRCLRKNVDLVLSSIRGRELR
jgi:ABC-type Zn uptake system ZnuABC Zn-binding protein ZnuA